MTIEKSKIISMAVDTTGLQGLPENRGPAAVFHMVVMQFMIAWGEQQGGAVLKEQKLLYRVRQKLEAALKTSDTRLVLEQDEFDFLDKCRNEVKLDFKANEAIMRVNALIDEAVTK